jgi:hypothetical protein
VSRTADARRLAAALTSQTHVHVEVTWDGSKRWMVSWQGGPTLANMRQLVERWVPTVAPSFAGLRLDWHRGRPARAYARALIAATRAGEPIELNMWELEERLDATEYPELAADSEEGELVERLVRLAGDTWPHGMVRILAAYGLGALGAGEAPVGVSSIEQHRVTRAQRATGGYSCPAAATGIRVTAATSGVADKAECPCGASWSRPAGDVAGDTLGEWALEHRPARP